MIVLTLCPPWSRDRLLAGRDPLLQLGYLVSVVLLVRHPRYALHYIGRGSTLLILPIVAETRAVALS
jgi:hypothetical protein